MSFSLVAYESSDEDSENEGNESTGTIASKVDNNTIESVISQTCSKLSCIPKTISHSTNDKEETEEKEEEQEKQEEDEEEEEKKSSNNTEDFKSFFNVLPKPKNFDSTENIEEDDDILLKNKLKYPTATQTKKQTIKITVPSLSEFKDIEEQKEKKLTRIVQPSEKGCGLFALLVPPKEQKANNKTLIPQAVKNAAVKINTRQPNVSEGCIKRDNSRTKKSTVDKSHNELPSDDDEEDAAMDFFGLTADENTLQNYPEVELSDPNRIEESSFTKSMDDSSRNLSCSNRDVSTSDESNNSSSKTLTSNVINLPKEEILLKNKAEVGPKLPVPEQEYNIDTKGNVAFDEKAIEYLCGKRGVKRKDKEIDEANIIEISGEDIKPDEREWLVKALTEEPVQRPVSMQSCGIGSQSKKKHQITYLAHQAKAMELELKNQWSQNRMTRKQTKSKYGF